MEGLLAIIKKQQHTMAGLQDALQVLERQHSGNQKVRGSDGAFENCCAWLRVAMCSSVSIADFSSEL